MKETKDKPATEPAAVTEEQAAALRAEGRAESEAEWRRKQRRWDVERAILASGADPKALDDVAAAVEARMERDRLTVPADALAAVRQSSPGLFQPKGTPGGGGGRNVSDAPLTADQVRAIYARGEQDKHRAQLDDYHKARATVGPQLHRPSWARE
jgi:hypothetical protein